MQGGRDKSLSELGDRIDRLNRMPLRPGVILAISLASFFTYYDITNYSYIAPVLRSAWGATDAEVAGGASLTVLGYVAGALSITFLADWKGRRQAFIVSILLLGIGSLLAASAQNMPQLMAFRFITGAGIGSELAIASVYIGEMSPKSKRGRYTSIMTVIGWIGLVSSGPVSLSLVGGQFLGIEGWRIVLGIAGAVALVSLPFRAQMPESLRWLLSKGKLAEANRILASVGLDPLKSGEQDDDPTKRSLEFLKDHGVLLKVLLLGITWFLMLIPIYASLLLVVEYVNLGYSVIESITINVWSSLGFVAGGIMAFLVADRIERKYQIALAGLAMSIGFVLRGLLAEDLNGLIAAGFVAFYANAWLVASLLVYTAENFPTRIRSSATGIVEGSSRGLAAVAPFVFIALQPFGFLNMMIGIAAFSLAGSIILAVAGVRTSGRSLEQLNPR